MDTVDGQETVGNSLGRAPLGGSETEAWTPWGSSYGMERDGSVDTLGRWEIVMASGELRWEGARRKVTEAWTSWTVKP